MMQIALRPRLRRLIAGVKARATASTHRDAQLRFIRPCYWIADRLTARSVILDFGLGFDADFSQAIIDRYGCISHGYDPTAKHQQSLVEVSQQLRGRLVVHSKAIGAGGGKMRFYESVQNVSGSMVPRHPNVLRDRVRSYEVDVVTLSDAVVSAGGHVDLVKMDIEGSEYEVLRGASDAMLGAVDQWVVEFHHDLIRSIRFRETRNLLHRFMSLGFRQYTRDGVNYLLYQPKPRG